MAGYTKLFSTIVTSSIWREDNVTRIVWVTLLALADARGHVDAAIPGLAAAANVDLDECERAVAKLEAPDKYSRTPHDEGRRIAKEEGGWRILNYAYYREKGRERDRKQYMRDYQRNRRRRKVKEAGQKNVNNVNQQLTGVNRCNPNAEAYTPLYPPKGGLFLEKGNETTEHERTIQQRLQRYAPARSAPVEKRRGGDDCLDDPRPESDPEHSADRPEGGDGLRRGPQGNLAERHEAVSRS
jgi:hypothetical protein